MTRPYLPEERAADQIVDGDPFPPEEIRHNVVTVENDDWHDTQKCAACGKRDLIIEPERCPAKQLPNENQARIEQRATLADGRDRALTEFVTVGVRQ